MYFIHIPKTAGTSFRQAAERYFGDGAFFDYGPSSVNTNRLFLDYEYTERDRYKIGKVLQTQSQFTCGHFAYRKYHQFFSAQETLSFLRDPVAQVRSHYEHFVRHHGYKKNYSDFFRTDRFINIQSRHLAGIWLDAIGFLGLTSEYEASIKLINSVYGVNFNVLESNRRSKLQPVYQHTKDEIREIRNLNSKDIALFRYGVERFNRQKQAIEQGMDFVRGGLLSSARHKKGRGVNAWACCYGNDTPRVIQVINENRTIDEVVADEYRMQAQLRGMPREGFIGLSFFYPDSLKPGSIVGFVDKTTGVLLFEDVVSDRPRGLALE